MTTKPVKGIRIKDGKVEKSSNPKRSVSAKIAQRKSKKVRVVRRSP